MIDFATNEAQHDGQAAAYLWLTMEALLEGDRYDWRHARIYMARALHHSNMAGRYGMLANRAVQG